MFIVLLEYTAPLEKLDACLDEHRALLAEGLSSGSLIVAGRKVPRTGGAMIFKLSSCTEVDAFIARDPFFKLGLAKYEVIELQPTAVSPSFAALL